MINKFLCFPFKFFYHIFQYFNNTLNLEDDPRVQVLLGTKSFLEGKNLNKKRNLSAQRIKVIGSDDQVGIAKAFLSLVKYAKTEHVLFLEEDFTLENSKNTDTSDTTNTDETESQKICNESIYYSTRKNNINMIKVL